MGVLVGALLTACEGDVSQPLQHATEPAVEWVDKKVGAHQLRFLVPKGWQYLDQGSTQTLRKDGAVLVLEDLGTYSKSGTAQHITQAQELYRGGDKLAAQEHLKRLPNLQTVFLKTDDWRHVEPHWRTLVHSQEQGQVERITEAYDQTLLILSRQPETDFEAVANKLLRIEDRNRQRDIASRDIVSIDGRKAVRVETWDKLSHSMKTKHLFVLNQDNILGMSVRLGRYEDIAPAFDQITASIQFPIKGAP